MVKAGQQDEGGRREGRVGCALDVRVALDAEGAGKRSASDPLDEQGERRAHLGFGYETPVSWYCELAILVVSSLSVEAVRFCRRRERERASTRDWRSKGTHLAVALRLCSRSS